MSKETEKNAGPDSWLAAALLIGFNFLPLGGLLRFILYLIPYLVIGYDILIKAFKGIRNRQPFDESLLMTIATIGAIAIAIYNEVVNHEAGDYVEAIAVMLFYQVGEWFQSYAVGKSRRNISDLMDIRPDYANIETDGKLEQIDPDEVEIGSVIVVQPGEKVPIDGIVIEGTSTLNTSALTGESLPERCTGGGRDHQRMHQYDRSSKDTDHERVRGVHGVKDPGSGGKRKLQKIKIRKLYYQICTGLYPGSCLQCHRARNSSAACADVRYGDPGRVGVPGSHAPLQFLS